MIVKLVSAALVAIVLVLSSGGGGAALAQASRAAEADPGQYTFRIRYDGKVRKFLVYVPQQVREGRPLPLVVGLHGGGGNAAQFMRERSYGVPSAAEKHGFVAVVPNGYSAARRGRFATWNAGQCCGKARDDNSPDVEFIAAVVERVQAQVDIDDSRIYAMGMSNGGMMSYRLACEMSETFAGIMAVAGTDNTQSCDASKPVPVLHVHALDDTHVLFGGGAGEDAFRDRSQITDFTSVPDTIDAWIGRNNATEQALRIKDIDGAWCDFYAAKAGGAPVQLCVTETGGHSWPGRGRTRRGKLPPSPAINAIDEMFAFFERAS